MPTRVDYLSFLEEFSLSESSVLPIADIKKLPPEGIAMLISGLASVKDSREKAALELMAKTLTEGTNTNQLLEKLAENLKKDWAAIRVSAPKNAYIGVFPTNSFNAQCTYRKNGYLVLLDTGCFELIEAATYVLLCTADQQTKTKALASVLTKYLEENALPDAGSMNLPGLGGSGSFPRLNLAYVSVTSAEEFVIAHEYGHITNKHVTPTTDESSGLHFRINSLKLGQPRRQNSPEGVSKSSLLKRLFGGQSRNVTPTILMAAGKSLEVIAKEKNQEYEADIWATHALVTRAQEKGSDALPVACAGPVISLGLALLIEEYMKDKSLPLNDTHPPAAERLYMVDALYELLGVRDQAYVGRRFLELVGDCAQAMFHRQVAVPVLDRELNRSFELALNNVGIRYDRPNWMDFR
jgi:Peptidase family M48